MFVEVCARQRSEVTMAKAKPKNKTIERLAIEAALALAAEYYMSPVGTLRVSDVRPISSGLFPSCWNRWPLLPETEQVRFSRFLRVRPDALGDDRAFLHGVQAALDDGSAFCWNDRSENDPWLHTWKPVPGKPLLQLVDELLEQISKKRRDNVPPDVQSGVADSVALKSKRASFLIPKDHLSSKNAEWPTIVRSGNSSPLAFDRDHLLSTAALMDQAGVCGSHHQARVGKFLAEACEPDGHALPNVLELPKGKTTM